MVHDSGFGVGPIRLGTSSVGIGAMNSSATREVHGGGIRRTTLVSAAWAWSGGAETAANAAAANGRRKAMRPCMGDRGLGTEGGARGSLSLAGPDSGRIPGFLPSALAVVRS